MPVRTDTKFSRILSVLSLFSSFGTLLCCALPALLITLGMGMTLVSLTSTVPWLFALSRYKSVLFTIAGILLFLSFYLLYVFPKRNAVCEDGTCEVTGKYSKAVFWVSLILFCIGVTTAYVYVPLITYIGE